jgi:hypothetical protein
MLDVTLVELNVCEEGLSGGLVSGMIDVIYGAFILLLKFGLDSRLLGSK